MARGRRATRAAWKAVLESKQAGRGAHHAASVHVRRMRASFETIDVAGTMHKFGTLVDGAFFGGPCFLSGATSPCYKGVLPHKNGKNAFWSVPENRMQK